MFYQGGPKQRMGMSAIPPLSYDPKPMSADWISHGANHASRGNVVSCSCRPLGETFDALIGRLLRRLLIPHNLPLPGRHHAFLAHGLVVADRQPFGDPATRPAISRTPTFTHHALVLGGRHDRSVLAEGGPQKAQTGPVDEGGAVNVRLAIPVSRACVVALER